MCQVENWTQKEYACAGRADLVFTGNLNPSQGTKVPTFALCLSNIDITTIGFNYR
jgi:hypothetical protein